MGQTIYWEPVENIREALPTMAPLSFRSTLERVFGILPIRLCDEDIVRLQTLRDAIQQDAPSYDMLIGAIGKYGTVELSSE